jgi:hypothetical protein
VGYIGDENKKGREMAKYGYQIDKGLSNDNQQVYFNPESKKLLYNVTGSQSLNDWVNVDAKLALGGTIGKGIKAIGKPLERGISALGIIENLCVSTERLRCISSSRSSALLLT